MNAMGNTFKALESEFEFVLEEVMEISLCVFFEIMSVPGGSGYSSGGGGGSNNDQPHKKKDDDEELLRAKRIAGADYGQKFGYHSHFYYQPPFSWWFSYGQIK